MTNEQREAIDSLQELVNLRKRKNNIKHDTCICGTEELDTVLSLIKEQDKQIDLMAEFIATLDIEEDICANVENNNCDKMAFGECENCIKQYFENKVNSFEQN